MFKISQKFSNAGWIALGLIAVNGAVPTLANARDPIPVAPFVQGSVSKDGSSSGMVSLQMPLDSDGIATVSLGAGHDAKKDKTRVIGGLVGEVGRGIGEHRPAQEWGNAGRLELMVLPKTVEASVAAGVRYTPSQNFSFTLGYSPLGYLEDSVNDRRGLYNTLNVTMTQNIADILQVTEKGTYGVIGLIGNTKGDRKMASVELSHAIGELTKPHLFIAAKGLTDRIETKKNSVEKVSTDQRLEFSVGVAW